MAEPVRLQLSRKKGFDLQAQSRAVNGLPAVSVARPGKWGNPYTVEEFGRDEAVRGFRAMVLSPDEGELSFRRGYLPTCEEIVSELLGKNLACWCKGSPCHADVLLELANAEPERTA